MIVCKIHGSLQVTQPHRIITQLWSSPTAQRLSVSLISLFWVHGLNLNCLYWLTASSCCVKRSEESSAHSLTAQHRMTHCWRRQMFPLSVCDWVGYKNRVNIWLQLVIWTQTKQLKVADSQCLLDISIGNCMQLNTIYNFTIIYQCCQKYLLYVGLKNRLFFCIGLIFSINLIKLLH